MRPDQSHNKTSVLARGLDRVRSMLPGIALSAVVTGVALAIQSVEERVFDHPYLEAIVIAIVLGMLVRTAWQPGPRWRSGIAFSAKQVLEVAVTLLGASISFATIAASGGALLFATLATVAVVLPISYGISRLLGLPVRLSILVACGNSVCGNSAIAAVAPVIGANQDDIASSISFTAVLGVLVVLGLPLLIPLLSLTAAQYGVLAGLTVYAVPQVLAATLPAGLLSTQIGTVVKLVRVLTLGPIVLGFSIFGHRLRSGADTGPAVPIRFYQAVPWFIIGFLVLASLRSSGLLPAEWAAMLLKVASVLTVVSMAALGLGVDIRILGRIGARVTSAVMLSLVVLMAIGYAVARALA
jgi:uncharacterized integral membrane protein (TIGR00698 family)